MPTKNDYIQTLKFIIGYLEQDCNIEQKIRKLQNSNTSHEYITEEWQRQAKILSVIQDDMNKDNDKNISTNQETSYEDNLIPDRSHYEGEWLPYRSRNR